MPDSGLPLVDGAIPDVPRTRSYQSPFDASEQDIYRVRIEFERQAGSRLTFRDRLYFTDLAWDSDGTLINGAGGPAPFTQAAQGSTRFLSRR